MHACRSTLEDPTAVVRRTADDIQMERFDALAVLEARRVVRSLLELAEPGPERINRLNELISVSEGSAVNGARRRAYLAAVNADVAATRGGVRLQSGRTIRLSSREGRIPLVLLNDNPFPVTVTLELESEKLEFTDSADRSRRSVTVELAPEQRHTEIVPVRARTSAAFPLRAKLLSRSGSELSRSQFTVVSTAVPGVGIALSVGTGLFLLLWWSRHWRKTRRSRLLTPVEGEPAA